MRRTDSKLDDSKGRRRLGCSRDKTQGDKAIHQQDNSATKKRQVRVRTHADRPLEAGKKEEENAASNAKASNDKVRNPQKVVLATNP